MGDDLVKRLRSVHWSNLTHEAADEIERLREAADALEAYRDALTAFAYRDDLGPILLRERGNARELIESGVYRPHLPRRSAVENKDCT